MELELMDWKNTEKNASDMLRETLLGCKINKLILARAEEEIHKLGGLTIGEQTAKDKMAREESEKNA